MDETIMAQTNLGDLLNSLINAEWEAVSRIRGAMSFLQSLEINPEIEEIFNDILNDSMIHIGQLEKGLQLVVPEAAKIEDGKEEAEQQLTLPGEEVGEEVTIEPEEEVEENLTEAVYTDNVPSYVHIASVGLYSSGCDQAEYDKEAEEGHYEIDMDNHVYTRVKGHNYLGNWFVESFPRDTMDEVEQTAKNIMKSGDFEEVSNEEYLEIQDSWNKS